MSESALPEGLLDLLRQVDTPTVCNAIEVAQGKRGFGRFTRGTMQHSQPGTAAIVGYARTARISGVAPSTEPPEVVRARRLDYFRAMAGGAGPTVAVVEDVDYPNCIAGWWGEVHVAVHKGLGLAGAVTNGVLRDLDVIDEGFPVLAGSIGPSHGYVHITEIGSEVSIMGMRVGQEDLIHADRHGALVIPAEVIPTLKQAVETVFANERIILDAARAPGFDITRLEKAWAKFEAERT
ncbi:Regulator of RNase E activity RraA [Roseovarius nanhaiticus]|uniref:Regulator of RNase E activity RraA n=1 Tax=Roseovarius nanhaiticus TaxID=573024 RepID=A0A1N7HN74_9RHOB|nr:acyl transferase [Roseovarius nanhaiticus]SEL36839.1 Regulator of RNase E activity RraA [Roseovarius nanhaiticus]SIS26221.1 Regulator of RNase E activity RraA [Roseovarius nanhaiticus]